MSSPWFKDNCDPFRRVGILRISGNGRCLRAEIEPSPVPNTGWLWKERPDYPQDFQDPHCTRGTKFPEYIFRTICTSDSTNDRGLSPKLCRYLFLYFHITHTAYPVTQTTIETVLRLCHRISVVYVRNILRLYEIDNGEGIYFYARQTIRDYNLFCKSCTNILTRLCGIFSPQIQIFP